MASSYSSDLKLELMATGENAGTWGDKTNTNLNLVQQAIAGFEQVTLSSGGTLALAMSNGQLSNARNLVIKFATATIAASTVCTIPDSIEKFYIFDCSGLTNANNLTIKTASGTGIALPIGSKSLVYSDGTNINLGIREKGYYTVPGAYTAVEGDQLLVDTSGSGIGSAVTITLPASPSVGSEVTFIDSGNNFASNNLTIARNGSNILGAASNLVVSANASAFTLVFVNATRGWAYKDKI